MVDTQHWADIVDSFMKPYKWIMTTEALAAYTQGLQRMRESGWPKPFVIAGTTGVGDLPAPDLAATVILGTIADTMMGGIRAFDAALRTLPREVRDRIDEWDPDGTGRYLASFLDGEGSLHGRQSWGARPQVWVELENKITIGDLWTAAGVPQTDYEIVPPGGDLAAAARRMDRGSGTAWACDNKEGWHGGGEYLRYVADPDDAAGAITFMRQHAEQVRVMPFLKGVACSIHGMVFPDYVASFRPVEMVVFRSPGSDRLRYSGASTTWDPPDADREEMRAIAKRVGRHLREHHDFRGAFTVDGVMTSEGFLPTELNARPGAGLFVQTRGMADFPVIGLGRCLIAREPADYRPRELEQIVLEGADALRSLNGIAPIHRKVTESHTLHVRLDDGRIVSCDEADSEGTLMFGPAAHGGIVMIRFAPEHSPSGVQAAPIIATGLNLADERWDTGIGELIPTVEVR
ncbi:hypothetical protein HQ535_04950 [bacterium]|nr:hypothetical protein [bacterium]